MPGCALRYCKNTSKNISKSGGITFHRFLRPGHEKREAWIKFVQKDRSEDTWLPSEQTCICSAHFNENDFKYTKTGRKFLKRSAMPCYPFANQKSGSESPSSLADVEVSDSESIFDTPIKIKFKKDLSDATAAKRMLMKENIKLKRQNKNLKKKNEKLTNIVERLKEKFGISSGEIDETL